MSEKKISKPKKIEFSKPKKIEPPEGEILDSVTAKLGEDKTSPDVDTEQVRASFDAIGWSPESGQRKKWVGWDDWDSVR
jgi:hypothetical protein